jgi:hypothetical protein
VKTIEAYMPEDLVSADPRKTKLEKRPYLPQFNTRDLSQSRDGVCVPCVMPNTIKWLRAK